MRLFFRKKKPIIHLYTICWNEEDMLEFFFNYYDPIVDKYIFFDDGSNDKTLDILSRHPKTEVRTLPKVDLNSYILAAQEIHNSCWKESRGKAEWVILTAVDEFLYHPALIEYLKKCQKSGISAIPALGYQMISDTFPAKNSELIKTVRNGAAWNKMNKLSLFRPDLIEETNYQPGRHVAKPKGSIKYPERDELLNLHFKYLSFEFTFERHKVLGEKLRSYDKEKNWGHKYKWDRETLMNDWNFFQSNSTENVVLNAKKVHNSHSPISERWWRVPDHPKDR